MTYKHWLVIAIILGLFALNIYCDNIIINTLNYLSSLPKLIAITIGVLFLLFPRFMEEVDPKQFIPTSSSLETPNIYNKNNFNNFNNFNNPELFTTKTLSTQNNKKISKTTKNMVAARQKWKCNSCKKLLDHKYKIEYKTPIQEGGTNFPDNLQAVCYQCTKAKKLK